MGRETIYGPDIEQEIIDRLSEGEGLKAICRDDHMPSAGTVLGWVVPGGRCEKREFADRYLRAREIGFMLLAEDLLPISDDGSADVIERTKEDGSTYTVTDHEVVQRSKLRADTRKWMLAKMLPKVYGEKKTEDEAGTDKTIIIRGGLPE